MRLPAGPYRIKWTQKAIRHLDTVHAYYAQYNPAAAGGLFVTIRHSVERLADFPESGRLSMDASHREIVVSGTYFIVAYRIRDKHIEILRVFHSKRKYSDQIH